jgi:ribosomal protein L7/L12
MKRVVITGWIVGFNKIETNKRLRAYLGLDLRDAKDAVDAIMRREVVEFELPDDQAAQLCEELGRLGAICTIMEGA